MCERTRLRPVALQFTLFFFRCLASLFLSIRI